MTRRPAAARRGITLTEILISILIMGIGLISLATLFPLGMVRLRAANQQHRSALLGESATADLSALNLLYKPTFFLSWYGGAYDPFTQDGVGGLQAPINVLVGKGPQTVVYSYAALPVCYDPLFWYVVGPTISPATTAANGEFRFGQGVFLVPSANHFLRADPFDKLPAAAYGLQRITNFNPALAGWSLRNASAIFVSPDDPVMQNADAPPQILTGATTSTNIDLSGVVPQVINGSFTNDWRYTWLFTGNQVDVTNGTAFVGNVVVMDSRPLAVDSVTSPSTSTASSTASGETVMEAIFGYSANVVGGFGTAADRTVLLRWPTAMPDPDIKAGGWIADVTYERTQSRMNTLASVNGGPLPLGYSMQRCHWYQVSKKTDVQSDPDVTGYRRLIVTVSTPVKDRTLLNSGGTAVVLNTALYMPSVVNVFQRTIFVRTDP